MAERNVPLLAEKIRQAITSGRLRCYLDWLDGKELNGGELGAALMVRDALQMADGRESEDEAQPKAVFIYVMTEEGAVKIGVSNDPEARARNLNTGRSTPLAVGRVFETRGRDHSREVEKLVHIALNDRRLSGEWFAVDVDVASRVIERAISNSGGREP